MYTVEYYSAIKKNEIIPFAATWMDLEIIRLSEGREDKDHTILLIYGILKRNDSYECICKTEIDSQT